MFALMGHGLNALTGAGTRGDGMTAAGPELDVTTLFSLRGRGRQCCDWRHLQQMQEASALKRLVCQQPLLFRTFSFLPLSVPHAPHRRLPASTFEKLLYRAAQTFLRLDHVELSSQRAARSSSRTSICRIGAPPDCVVSLYLYALTPLHCGYGHVALHFARAPSSISVLFAFTVSHLRFHLTAFCTLRRFLAHRFVTRTRRFYTPARLVA